MNLGDPYLGRAFTHLYQLSTILNNPNLIVFASGFSENTINSESRKSAIQQLTKELKIYSK